MCGAKWMNANKLLLGSHTWSTRIAVACIELWARPPVAGVTDWAFTTLGAFYSIVAVDIPVAYKDIKNETLYSNTGWSAESKQQQQRRRHRINFNANFFTLQYSIQRMHWNRFRIARRWFLAVYFMHMLTQRWVMARNANRAIFFFFSLLLLFFVESEGDFYSVRQLKVCPNHYYLSLSYPLLGFIFSLSINKQHQRWSGDAKKRELN